MSHILRTSTEYVTAPLADEGNYAYCQSVYIHIPSQWEANSMKLQEWFTYDAIQLNCYVYICF